MRCSSVYSQLPVSCTGWPNGLTVNGCSGRRSSMRASRCRRAGRAEAALAGAWLRHLRSKTRELRGARDSRLQADGQAAGPGQQGRGSRVIGGRSQRWGSAQARRAAAPPSVASAGGRAARAATASRRAARVRRGPSRAWCSIRPSGAPSAARSAAPAPARGLPRSAPPSRYWRLQSMSTGSSGKRLLRRRATVARQCGKAQLGQQRRRVRRRSGSTAA